MGADQSAVSQWVNAEKINNIAIEKTQKLIQKDLLLD
jgi:hypothetical protein